MSFLLLLAGIDMNAPSAFGLPLGTVIVIWFLLKAMQQSGEGSGNESREAHREQTSSSGRTDESREAHREQKRAERARMEREGDSLRELFQRERESDNNYSLREHIREKEIRGQEKSLLDENMKPESQEKSQPKKGIASTIIWIKRGDTVKGPISLEKMQKLIHSKLTRMTDEVAVAEDGPWKPLLNVYKSIMNK